MCSVGKYLSLILNILTVLVLTPESLNELEDIDLDALMADLMADLNATEEKLAAQIEDLKVPSPPPQPPPEGLSIRPVASPTSSGVSASATSPLPPPPPQSAKPTKVSHRDDSSRTSSPLRCWEPVQR